MSDLSIITTFWTLLIALLSANKGSDSMIHDSPQNQIDIDLSPSVNNLFAGFNCKNPANVESFELESVKKSKDRVQETSTKEAYIQILQESDEHTITANMCTQV